jgi:hypothetical protein
MREIRQYNKLDILATHTGKDDHEFTAPIFRTGSKYGRFVKPANYHFGFIFTQSSQDY